MSATYSQMVQKNKTVCTLYKREWVKCKLVHLNEEYMNLFSYSCNFLQV